jgi:hypothetical protein
MYPARSAASSEPSAAIGPATSCSIVAWSWAATASLVTAVRSSKMSSSSRAASSQRSTNTRTSISPRSLAGTACRSGASSSAVAAAVNNPAFDPK